MGNAWKLSCSAWLTVHFGLGSSWLCSHGSELCSGAETPSSFLLAGLVSPRPFSKAPLQIQALMDAAPEQAGVLEELLSDFAFSCSWRWPEQRAVPGQTVRGVVAVAEPAPQPAEQRPALTPTAQPDRGVPGEQWAQGPLITSLSEIEPWPLRIRCSRACSPSLLPCAAVALHCSQLPLAAEVVWVSATQQHLCWCRMLFSLLFGPYT